MLNCKICGSAFPAVRQNHYISRGDGETGLATLMRTTEFPLFDTFDCPMCGCQVVAQPRNRIFVTDSAEALDADFSPIDDDDAGESNE